MTFAEQYMLAFKAGFMTDHFLRFWGYCNKNVCACVYVCVCVRFCSFCFLFAFCLDTNILLSFVACCSVLFSWKFCHNFYDLLFKAFSPMCVCLSSETLLQLIVHKLIL